MELEANRPGQNSHGNNTSFFATSCVRRRSRAACCADTPPDDDGGAPRRNVRVMSVFRRCQETEIEFWFFLKKK